MVCPKCGRENQDNKMVCVECGNELKTVHIHSHRVKGRTEEVFTMILFFVLVVPSIFFTIKYFNIQLLYVSLGLLLFELFVLLAIYEIFRCLFSGRKLNKAYIEGNVKEAEIWVKKYAGYKKVYQKLLPGVIASLLVSIGINVLFYYGNVDNISSIFKYAGLITILLIIIGIVEMIRNN